MHIKVVVGSLFVALARAHEEYEDGESDMKMDMHSAAASSALSADAATSTMVMDMPAPGTDAAMDMPMGHNHTLKPSPASSKGGHSHGMPILDMLDMLEPQQKAYWLAYDPTTYFNSEGGSKSLLGLHAILQVLALGFLHPVASLLSLNRQTQWIYIPLQTLVVLISVGSAVVCLFYSFTQDEDLYPGNCYSKVLVIFLTCLVVQWISLVSKSITSGFGNTALDGVEYHMTNFERRSQDSGNALDDLPDEEEQEEEMRMRVPRSAFVNRLANSQFGGVFKVFHGFSSLLFNILTIPLVLFGYAVLLFGAFISTRMGIGHTIFGLAAHAIKGSVFIILGFVELARFFGAFARQGMAWNMVPTYSKEAPSSSWIRRMFPEYPTMEYYQSFLIFFYGCSNVFLEHLGNTDGKWSAKDMQHVSIAFMFFGGGLLGMVLESEFVAKMFAQAFGYEHARRDVRSWSINPIPALIIFWTGALMSQHQQETPLATAIHVQWGTLLSAAACIRGATYGLLYLKSTQGISEAPQRPFTELLCSFCLICGGMIFVLSNRETVEAMIYQGISSMFSLIVGVGITSLLMVVAALALAFKGYVSR